MRRALLFLALLSAALPAAAQVRVWEGTLSLPVYEEGSPDPNPPFDQFETTRFSYPYTLRKEITDQRVNHNLRAIYLENEYLKCSVLPDIGGHLYTCIDKISGQPMFYANPSLKKAQIGYRGAWAAFGIEFNFPVSHNWMSMSPVGFSYATHKDGSASVTVGNIDRVYGMEWCVELLLRPGSTVLQQQVTLSNRGDVRHRFYWWNNAAVEVWDDSRIQYPMRFAASHGFTEVQTWPLDSVGKDLSVIRNQTDGPVSLFVHGSRENFMGVWNPHTNFGTAHFADYAPLPAKKIWSWGVDADGLDWRKALSDNNSAYVELQAGLFRNQETYSFLEPRQTIAFTEYWMPVRETGGISRANRNGVVHLERRNGTLVVTLNSNQKFTGASIHIKTGTETILDEKLDLAPEKSWKKEIAASAPAQKYTFELTGPDGTQLLTQTEDDYNWLPESEIKVGPQKSYRIPPPEARSEDDWLQFGRAAELDGEILIAAKTYEQAIGKFSGSFELRKALGRLYASIKRYDEAQPLLAGVHDRNTTDGEISYYLGIAYDGLNRPSAAIDAYEEAMRFPSYRASAALRLAECYARQQDWRKAKASLEEGQRSASTDLRTAEELSAVLHAMGNTAAAQALAAEWLVHFPLSDFLREESAKPNVRHLAGDPYRVLNIATQYARLGLYQRAIEVLSREYPAVAADEHEPGAVLPQQNPLLIYFRGYCREKAGQSGADDFAQAAKLSTLYIFPDSGEDLRSLQSAIQANSSDASAHYLLGTWYFARAKTDAALGEWEAARKLNPAIPSLAASIGNALLHMTRDNEGALRAFREGIANDPKNLLNYSGASAAMSLLGKPAIERAGILEKYPDLPHMPSPLVYELALTRAEAGNYEGAIALFRNRFFGREEGGTNVRQVWVEVRLQQALGLAHQHKCQEAVAIANGLGSPVEGLVFTQDGLQTAVNAARTQYLLAEVFSSCGESAAADEHFRNAAQSPEVSQTLWAWAAARKRAGFDPSAWQDRLKAALADAVTKTSASSFKSWWMYARGTLQIALGEMEAGKESLQEALLMPESLMSYHFTRLANEGATPR
jgi:tetratricopeptide (TPR) repeat protein